MKACPQCHLLLEQVEWQSVPVWACRNCGGTWLEAPAFAHAMGAARSRLGDLDQELPGVASAGTFAGLTKTCPTCRIKPLAAAPLPGADGAEGWTCAVCGGVWLEPGERTRLAGGPAQPPRPAPPAPVVETSAVPEPVPVPSPPEPQAEPPTPLPEPSPVAQPVLLPEPLPVLETDAPNPPPAPIAAAALDAEPLPDPVPEPAAEAPAEPSGAVGGGAGALPAFEAPPHPFAPVQPHAPAAPPGPPVADTEEEETQRLLLELARAGDALVCPRCLRAVDRAHEQCSGCNVVLVEPDLEVACPSCGAATTFVAQACERCGTRLRTPEMLDALYPRMGIQPARGPLTEPRDEAPRVRRGSPEAPPLRPGRFCPRCRGAYAPDLSFCTQCGLALVDAGYRVRCGRCRAEVAIGSERCWRCDNPIEAIGRGRSRRAAAGGLPTPVAGAPPPVRVRVTRSQNWESCSSSVAVLVAIAVVLLTLGWLAL